MKYSYTLTLLRATGPWSCEFPTMDQAILALRAAGEPAFIEPSLHPVSEDRPLVGVRLEGVNLTGYEVGQRVEHLATVAGLPDGIEGTVVRVTPPTFLASAGYVYVDFGVESDDPCALDFTNLIRQPHQLQAVQEVDHVAPQGS